jgi:hypothetical protein
VVVELVSNPDDSISSPFFVEEFELEQLLEETENYGQRVNGRVKRQQVNEMGGIYIAANLTEEELSFGFELGDGMQYQEFTNHALRPGRFYNVTLRGTIPGTDTPMYYTSSQPIGRYGIAGMLPSRSCGIEHSTVHIASIW